MHALDLSQEGSHVWSRDVIRLNWLPVNKAIQVSVLTLAYNSLYDVSFPEYLKLNLQKVGAFSLRSSIEHVLSIPKESTLGSNYF